MQDGKKYTIQIAFSLLDKDMKKKIYNYNDLTKTEYTEVMWSLHKKKHVLKLERIQKIATKLVPGLEDLMYEERLKQMHLTKLKERR